MHPDVQNPVSSAITPEEVYAELDVLVRSPLFSRSEKLQRFLRFVCEATLQGTADQINEYLIGSEVFRRGSDYNPSEDSIVRRHAHAMRQKLQEYYAHEGADHAIRIEMPVGRYVAVFRRKEELQATPERAVEPAAERHRSLAPRLLWGLAAVVIFALGWALADLRRPDAPPLSAAAREIWGPWIGAEAVISFSNPTSALVRHLPEPLPVSPPNTFRARPDQEGLFREKFKFPPGGAMYFNPTVVQTMMGEAVAATHVASLFARTGTLLRTTENRFLSWEDLRRENHILFGGDVGNKWVDAILDQYPFRLEVSGLNRRIVNTAPKPGEEQSFRVSGTEIRDEFALISMLPGVVANRQMLLLCGLNSPAMPLATEYLTTEQGLQQLLDRLQAAAPHHSGPWRFQAVISADVRDKVATKGSIVALRVL
jgi:hypothetical protein